MNVKTEVKRTITATLPHSNTDREVWIHLVSVDDSKWKLDVVSQSEDRVHELRDLELRGRDRIYELRDRLTEMIEQMAQAEQEKKQ